MKTLVTTCALLALTIPTFAPSQAIADELPRGSCKSVVGTYLATAEQTNSTSGQPSSYRELITFTADGNVIASDSTAGGVPGSSAPETQPFGIVQGTWKCTGRNQIVATAPNFYFASGSLAGSIAVTNYSLSFNPRTGKVSGNLVYDLYDLNSNPLKPGAIPLPGGPYQFSYQGRKVKISD